MSDKLWLGPGWGRLKGRVHWFDKKGFSLCWEAKRVPEIVTGEQIIDIPELCDACSYWHRRLVRAMLNGDHNPELPEAANAQI